MWWQPELFKLNYPEVLIVKPKRIRKPKTIIEIKQPELFNWNDPDVFIRPQKKRKVKKPVDYDALYKLFLAGPVRFKDIEEASGVSHNAVAQVITTLSLRYPIYEVKRGTYKLLGIEEYGDGIKHSLLSEDE